MSPEDTRLRLLAGGYDPIPCVGKYPIQQGWQLSFDVSELDIRSWSNLYPAAANTGILTRRTPTLDLDILDEEAIRAIEEHIHDRYDEGGYVLPRIGRAPKRCYPFRTDEPFAKILVKLIAPNGEEERIEFLADGQQVVCFGVHPDTKQPYQWPKGEPGLIQRADLPYIREVEAQSRVDDLVRILEPFGYRVKPRGNGGATHIWKSKDHDFPCTPTGVERRDDSGRIYASVVTPEGTEHIVPKDELVPARANGGETAGAVGWIPDLIDHDELAAFAMTLLVSGMCDRNVVNFLRAQVRGLKDVDEERRQRRLDEIAAMVTSARKKLGPRPPTPPPRGGGVLLEDFHAYMPMHCYIFAPTGQMWPATSVNARVRPIPVVDKAGKPILDDENKPKAQAASQWLDKNRAVEQMTWAPGLPALITDRLVADGGWISRKGVTCFNLYRPPTIELGDPARAKLWLDHGEKLYGEDFANHICPWLAHRVQRPGEKINHALVFGGPPGVGKDSLLEPVKQAVGPWNFSEVSPRQALGRFNGFLKSVILRISEARDLGEVDRFQFYDATKSLMAAPPDVLRVDEKNLKEYSIFNCCGVTITTNHKTDGLFLPTDDRRHLVEWSERVKEDFPDGY
jgi:hypothetical protein